MTKENITFPVYRKYLNEKVYFKIFSLDEWEEVHVLAGPGGVQRFKASIHPDRLYLRNMIYDYKEHWKECSPEEYENVRKMNSRDN